ncbi:serine/threonine-protein kinase BLUS1 isoform X2 [Cryptomeria japonica]|uniref:serine/threonine-protein kinase BLUS1 isoform X2 n=1 Tax=Cryptomeria japonica TaxID=3369 RepID=UPI0027DA00BE|nr:serine/threonine-protein kinase BLUS1 isoform X2 [Cryptomeria japonica]
MDQKTQKKYPLRSADYKLYEEVGQGVSATVYRALCIPFNQIVAVKVLDLEKCNSNLDGIRREVQTMSLIDHPNVLRAHCSFITDHSLWVVMPYMSGGSCLHIMKSAYPDGFEEPVIATFLRETLRALDYLHSHGHIHRDVKAGNILVDVDGAVKLADFGVSACMFDSGDRQRSRNTFVGTPCWMAPEVMEQIHGYDFKADIWSFGITALELAHGHAPFSKYPPMKVLLMTLQNAPPGFDYERDKKFSKSFKEMVAMCLVKDPTKRPSAAKLMKHRFFKHARSNDYIERTVLDGLPPLGERLKNLKLREMNKVAQNKVAFEEKEERSQSQYIRGISEWNFNLEDLKAQAALIQDDDEVPSSKKHPIDSKPTGENLKSMGVVPSSDSPWTIHSRKMESIGKDGDHDICVRPAPLSSPLLPQTVNFLKESFDVIDDGTNACSPTGKESTMPRHSRLETLQTQQDYFDSSKVRRKNSDKDCKLSEDVFHAPVHGHRVLSGPLVPEHVLASCSVGPGDGDREKHQRQLQQRNCSGPLVARSATNIDRSYDSLKPLDESMGPSVQQKGRFKVTSEDVDLEIYRPFLNQLQILHLLYH